MRWLLTFLLGVLVGAGGLFAWLHQMPHETPAPAQVANTGSLPPPAGPDIESKLPPAPKVTPDLTELDLPLRPSAAPATDATVNANQNAAANAPAPGKLMVPVDGMKLAGI